MTPTGRGGAAATWRWRDWIVYNATVFIAAACIMTVEILSTRLAARYLGSSLYTWTSAIGVVLAGISLGNYAGGRLADRFHPRRTLSVLFVLSAAACVSIPMVNAGLGDWSALDPLAWPTRIFLHFTLAFLLPATMLGTMSPVVAKMALDMGRATGRTIGTIYAWGAVGSIVGTFVAGFFLVASMGTEGSILLVAGVLALVGVFYGYRSWLPWAATAAYALVVLCWAGPWGPARSLGAALRLREPDHDWTVFLEDSQYQRVHVRVGDTASERTMVLDTLIHSRIDLADPLDLIYQYEMVYAEVVRQTRPPGTPVSAMFIGGGGYVFPRWVEIVYPGSVIEVAEIDPVVTRAAFEAFGVPTDTTIRAFDMDARNRVADLVRRKRAGDGSVPTFDLVFGDAFNDFSVPWHLTTVEFYTMLETLMTDDGLYLMNVIDMLDSGRLLGAVIATCREVFAHVEVYAVSASRDRNTFVVVAGKAPLGLGDVPEGVRSRHPGFAGIRLDDATMARLEAINGIVLTDDYAPVENFLAPVVRRYVTPGARRQAAEPHAEEMLRLAEAGRHDELIALCRRALAADPAAPKMHFRIGTALAAQGRPDEALAEYRAELEIVPDHATSHHRIGVLLRERGDAPQAVEAFRSGLAIEPADVELRSDLARALEDAGRPAEAEAEYREALRRHPGLVRAHVALANLLFGRGDLEGAAGAFGDAYRFAPDYPGLRRDLGLALLRAGRPAEAAGFFREAIAAGGEGAGLHNDLGRSLAAAGDLAGAITACTRAVELDPTDASYRSNLGLACEQTGRHAEAVEQYRACLERDPENLPVMNALARLLAASPDDAVRDGAAAVRRAEVLSRLLGGDNPEALDTLAAAYAEANRLDEAIATAARAAAAAEGTGLPDLAREIRGRLEVYRRGRPFRM